MRNFLVSLMLARALKNMWRNLIRAKKGTRIYEVCLKKTMKVLNSTLSLHTDTKTNNNKISFNEKLINIILSMFGRGLISTLKTLKENFNNNKGKGTDFALDHYQILSNVWYCLKCKQCTTFDR